MQTFSLALSWSNISWTSSFQSSCRDWKDSAGISKKPDSSIAVSWSRILVKGGRAWGSTFQQSRAGERNTHHRQTVSCHGSLRLGQWAFWLVNLFQFLYIQFKLIQLKRQFIQNWKFCLHLLYDFLGDVEMYWRCNVLIHHVAFYFTTYIIIVVISRF